MENKHCLALKILCYSVLLLIALTTCPNLLSSVSVFKNGWSKPVTIGFKVF